MLKKDRCFGCGALKQNISKDEVGYVKNLEFNYCESCFKIANYGQSNLHFHPNSYLEIKEDSLIFIISSIMQIDLLFSLPIKRIQPKAKYVYLINQIDLLPKETNFNFLYNNILKNARLNNVYYDDIFLISAINKRDIIDLKEYILKDERSNIYLFGYQNSGKTTILKALTGNETALNINKSGLTQDIISEPFFNKIIFDMPGIFKEGYLASFLGFDSYRKMLPYKKIKPKIYQLKSTQKLVINNFIEITFSNSLQANFIIFINDYNKIMKYNVENKNNYLDNNFEYEIKKIKVGEDKMQITIADLCFIQVLGKFNIEVKLPKKMHISIIKSMIK